MKRASAPLPAPAPVRVEPVLSYAEQLGALEARRRAADDVLLRKMVHLKDPMNPG